MDMRIKTSHSVRLSFCFVGSFLLFWGMFSANLVFAFGNTLGGKTKFAGTPSGIIRDIEVVKESTFIASENGVFHLLGGRSESITYNRTMSRGTVADLSLGLRNNIWIVEYGVGVFSYDLSSGISTQPYQTEKWPQYAWKIQELKDFLVVSLIQGVVVIDKNTGVIQDWAKEIGVGKVSKVFSVSAKNDSIAYLSSQNYLLKVDVTSRTVEKLPVNEFFSKLSSIETVSISQDFMFVGGREGLYKYNLKTKSQKFYPFKNNAISGYAMSDVFHTSDDKIYVAAGGLFELNEYSIEVPNFMSPLLSSEAIKSITGIRETQSNELLISSSQLGLISLTSTHEAINLVHKDGSALRSNIYGHGYDESSNFLVKTGKGIFGLNINNGELSSTSVEQDVHCISENSYLMRSIHFQNTAGFDYCKLKYASQFKVNNEAFYSYRDVGEEAVFELVQNGAIIDSFPAPEKLKRTFLSQSGEIVGFDEQNSVHIQMSKFNWKTITPNEGGWSSISCLIEFDGMFLVCTSGQGIRAINKKSGEIKNFNSFANEDLRFIRAGLLTKSGNLWFSTNKGLYVLSERGEIFSLAESEGIYDSDFEYGGISQVGEKILLLGDKYSYLIDEKLVLKAVETRARIKGEVIFSKFSWVDSENIVHSHHPQFSEDNLSISLDNDFVELGVNFVIDSRANSDREKLEFRILGIDDAWKPHPRSQAYLAISDIEYGDYEIQARVMGEGNPINSLRFTIGKPFYLLNEAFIFYFIILTSALWAYRKRLIQENWKKFKSTNLYTNLTRFEITDGQSKFEKMLRSKERQISEITHDLRTPIQVIKGSLEQLSNEKGEENKEFILIKENMRRVEQLIEQMRNDIPRASSPSDYYKTYSVEHIRFIVNSLEPLAKQKRQNLEVRVKGTRYISLINDSLEKIITNLLQNAIKYTGEYGNIRVIVSIDKKVLKIIVSDDGIGMDARLLGKVFERFTRGETQEEGQGIGLSIVKNLTELNQGKIDVESKPGEGSKFTVRLPVDDIEFVNTEAAQLELKGETTSQKTLLIVDDSREFRTYMFDLLSTNYRCLVAGNGEQALDVMQRFLVDLVVTDQIMPKMDGLTLTSEIRAHASHSNIPVIMLSAKTDPQLEKAALEVKVDYFLAKPASSEEISLRIAHFLSVRDAQSIDENGGNKPIFKFGCLEIPEINNEKDMAFYLNFIAVLEKNYHREEFNRDQAAEQLLMSTRSLNRRLAELFEYNFSEFLSRFRIEKSIPILLEGHSILDTCLDVGFGTAAYFSTSFKKVMKVPPKKYIEQYRKTVA